MEKKKNRFYYWVICGLCTLIIFVTMGVITNGFSILMPYIMQTYGFTNSQTSSLITIRCLIALIAMLCIGYYYNLISIRVGIAIAVACAGAAFCIFGMADSYPMFLVGAVFMGFSYGLGSMIPITILISRWFISHRALAIGICASGSGIATIILSPITTMLVESFSLRKTFFIEGALWIAIAVIVLLFLRNKPSEMRLRPYGQKELHDKIRAEGIKKGTVVTYTLSKKGWILMGGVCVCMGALANPGFSHLPILFTTEGFSSMMVAAVISALGIVITIGKIVFGEIMDKIGGFRGSILAFSIFLIGQALCCFAFLQSVPLCVATVLILGMGYPIATIGISVWSGDMASADKFPEVLRKLQIIYACGALTFSGMPGVIADMTGGYIPAYILFSILIFCSLVGIIAAYRESGRKIASSQKTKK